ncbi:kinase-like protein [Lentinus tigrinus ALCF2SS1-7]|uniref:Kinase-like protein n=1 Tax=Lentinus tigrinus ALCF2SS1-6 TaxID=1328759 RepID=A0A5C2SEU2_9APHY|nr:kinase-like protein [Lentinus tigrinus ALCF2SS1-6]RPD76035.1 kinase-like protein [Lentinus tigrinus ALCF2SS1-7]
MQSMKAHGRPSPGNVLLRLICFASRCKLAWTLWCWFPRTVRLACYRSLEEAGLPTHAMSKVVKLPCGLVLKRVNRSPFPEAANTRFVAERTSVPVPRILDVVEGHGPEPYGYILMTWIEGEPLRAWIAAHSQRTVEEMTAHAQLQEAMDSGNMEALEAAMGEIRALPPPRLDMSEGRELADDLREAFRGLRSLSPCNPCAISGLHGRPLSTARCGGPSMLGPFSSQDDFKDTVFSLAGGAVAYRLPELRRLAAPVRAKMHRVCFTHGDLHDGNILVKDGRLVGIIDWEHAGWYPEYWEATMMEYHMMGRPLNHQFWDDVQPFGTLCYDAELALEYALWRCTGTTTIADARGDDLSCPRYVRISFVPRLSLRGLLDCADEAVVAQGPMKGNF